MKRNLKQTANVGRAAKFYREHWYSEIEDLSSQRETLVKMGFPIASEYFESRRSLMNDFLMHLDSVELFYKKQIKGLKKKRTKSRK
jgi:hypothetical protein